MRNAPNHFANDLARLSAALAPYVLDGGWIDPNAPESLTRPYRALLSLGYANGWIA